MRLIDADELKRAIEDRIDYVPSNDYDEGWNSAINTAIDEIDTAPTVETKFELKTENGITYPKALDNMTFSHSLSVEERQNIIQAYMLGANANARPQGEWIIVKDERYGDNVKCPFCEKELAGTDLNFCCKCGAKLTGSEKMNGGAV